MTRLRRGHAARPPGEPDEKVSFHETVHGPVSGYATVGGAKVALALQRSTRGRELLERARLPGAEHEQGASSAQSFLQDDEQHRVHLQLVLRRRPRHRARSRAGGCRCARRARDPALPTVGHGRVRVARLPHARPSTPRRINPPGGVILNWNNKPARGVRRPPTTTGRYGSVQRVDLLARRSRGAGRSTRSRASISAMNKAATQDLRAVRGLAARSRPCSTGSTPPSARAADVPALLDGWRVEGRAAGSTGTSTARSTTPARRSMDAAWPKLADAVLGTVLGPLTRPPREADGPQRRRGPRRLGVHRRLVRLRGQGPALAARRPVKGAYDEVLRRR